MMTEAEAKTKICCGPPVAVPYWQLLIQVQASIANSAGVSEIKASALCAGSACMAWRNDAASGGGYCGLAGKP